MRVENLLDLPERLQANDVRFLVECHRELTGSERAGALLAEWEDCPGSFWGVAPVSEVDRIERANEGILGAAR